MRPTLTRISRSAFSRLVWHAIRRLVFWARGTILAQYCRKGHLRFLPSSRILEEDLYDPVLYRDGQSIVIPQPLVIRNDDALPHQRFVGTWRLPQPWYATIPEARLIGRLAVGLSDEHEVIGETISPEDYRRKLDLVPLKVLMRPSGRAEVSLDTACSLVGLWSREYYHWLVDYLPHLEAVEAFVSSSGLQPLLILDHAPTQWQIESLRLLGYGKDSIQEWTFSSARVRTLLVPAFSRRFCDPGHEFAVASPGGLDWLRTKLVSEASDSGQDQRARRILISRRQAPGRRLVNEDETMDHLEGRGFVLIDPSDLSFREQVCLFASAEVVIGPHGAGLTNILCCQDAKVIELYGSYWNRSIFSLAAARGLQYGAIRCQSRFRPHPHRHDLEVSQDDLSRMLDVMES